MPFVASVAAGWGTVINQSIN